ncbi:hypothetical protein PM082_023112 [Marasmius tenuissimus]|nr:hypothetical protein PM082_023112 [Marasmius tenuissimus]
MKASVPQTNASKNTSTADHGGTALADHGTAPGQSTALEPNMNVPKKRLHSDIGDALELQEATSSGDAHAGATGVNGVAKAKPLAKKAKLIDERDIRDPPCLKCKESNIPCIDNTTRSSCDACFQHHWKCTNAVTPPKSFKQSNAMSLSALNNDVRGSVGVEATRSTAGSWNNGTASLASPSRQESGPPTNTAQATTPARSTPWHRKSDLPVLMLAPESLSPYSPYMGRQPVPSKSKSTASTSTIPFKQKDSSPNRALVSPKAAVADQSRSERPRRRGTRRSGHRSRAYIEDSDSDLYDDPPPVLTSGKGKQKAVTKAQDASDLSTPSPASTQTTPDPMLELTSRSHMSLYSTNPPPTEPRILTIDSNLPTVITSLNTLNAVVASSRTDLVEVKKATASIARSQSALDWEVALDKLHTQDKVIQEQSKTIERQGRVIGALVKNMKELMGHNFNAPDLDESEANAKGTNCDMVNHPQTRLERGNLVSVRAVRTTPVRPTAGPLQLESTFSRPSLIHSTSRFDSIPVSSESNGLPPPRATSFMRTHKSRFPRSIGPASPQRRNSSATPAGSTANAMSKSMVPGVMSKFSIVPPRCSEDSEEERDELLDD